MLFTLHSSHVCGFASPRHAHRVQARTRDVATTERYFPLAAELDDNSSGSRVEEYEDQDNFDGKGFANYLAPYAAAVVASIAVTAAFVKFVLMDY